MKRKIIIFLIIIVGIYLGASNFPKYSSENKFNDILISIKITDNLLVFRDPEYTKLITIQDENETLKLKYWTENYPFKIYKRKKNNDTFWVIEDNYRGISRSEKGEFSEFICPDCSGIEKTTGINIAEFHFENDKLIEIIKK